MGTHVAGWRGAARRLIVAGTAVGLALTACTSAPVTAPPAATTTASSSPAPPPSTSTTPAPRTVTVAGSGDVLLHLPVDDQAHADAGGDGYDFSKVYAAIAPDLTGVDLATCEMETPLSTPTGPFTGWPTFDAPPQVATAIEQVGYRTCTTASNHTIDQGIAGVTRTLDALDAAGLGHTGSARSAAEAAKPLIVTAANGVRIAQLAYSFGFNGIPLPANTPWLANLTDIPTILAAAHRARAAGADIVVVSMHWGIEYDHLPSSTQTEQAKQLLASPDVDLILGDHTHSVQPLQKINGKWVIYSMGNQVSSHAEPNDTNRSGVMPIVTFTDGADGQFRASGVDVVPTWMQLAPDPIRLLDLARAIADPATPAGRLAEYQRIHGLIRGWLNAYGALSQGASLR